jgi:hypothetical protein
MNSIYVDQRWLDLLAASSADVKVLRDPGLNVAYWNLHERKLGLDARGQWTANDQPLKFFHFSGFDRHKLSTKAECHDPNALKLSEQYGQLLDGARDREFRDTPYGWNYYADGRPILPEHRDLILGRLPEFDEVADPFTLSAALGWDVIDTKSKSHAPVRVSRKFLESQASTAALYNLRHHPVVGIVWRLWERFVNPSLGSGCPPHVRS